MSREFSDHQRKIIKRYYDNREQIDSQRLSELGTELYLATGKKLEKLWQSAEQTMRRMKVPESRIGHILAKKDPSLVAEVVKDLETGKLKGG
jgi:hypothetical protein